MKNISPFFNPVEWFRAWRFKRSNARFPKSSYDHELYLYSKILSSRMLHYGYFDDTGIKPESISLGMVEDAQRRYAELLIENIEPENGAVLDVGCGMGGLAEMITSRGMEVEVLTPDRNQIEFIAKSQPGVKSHRCRYEEFVPERKYGTVINSESLQYIKLDDAFRKSGEVLAGGGRWIIADYFRLHGGGISKSAHMLDDFRSKAAENGWVIEVETDITPNILPTLDLVYMYFQRFLIPLKHYGYEKLRYKRPGLFYLSRKLRDSIDRKLEKESASLNPEMFRNEKRYMLFVLRKS